MTEYGPRTRELDKSLTDVDVNLIAYTHRNGNATPSDWIVTQKGRKDLRVTNDVVTRDFRKRMASGEIINNPYDTTHTVGGECIPTDMTYVGYDYDVDGHKLGVTCVGKQSAQSYLPDYLPLNPDDYLDMVQSVKDRAVTSAYADRSTVAMAASMALAEGKKTVQGIYEILFRVAEIALAAKRLDWKYLRSEISPAELKDRYMELRYAIRPLVIDCQNIVKASQAKMGESRKTARGGSDERVVFSDEVTEIRDTSMQITSSRTSAYIVEARAGVLCDVDVTGLSTWGIDQAAETILEITPWSFIVGWFINIADLVSSWTPKAGVTELASWVTLEETIVRNVTMTDCTWSPAYQNRYDVQQIEWSGQMTETIKFKARYPDPQRTVWPHWNVNLDTLKILDLGIILRGILSGKTKRFIR